MAVPSGTITFNPSVASHAFTIGSLSQGGAIALADTSSNPVAVSLGLSTYHSYSGTLTGAGSVKIIANIGMSGQSNFSGGTTLSTGGTLTVGGNGNTTSGPLGLGTVTFAGGGITGSTAANGAYTVANNVSVNGSGTINNGFTFSNPFNAAAGSTAANNSLTSPGPPRPPSR